MRHGGALCVTTDSSCLVWCLPPAYQAALCKRLVGIERASSAANCLIAQARAEGMVECLETLTHGIADGHIERLYV